MARASRVLAAAALASAALLPAVPASACHEVVAPIVVDTPAGPVHVFPGIYIPC